MLSWRGWHEAEVPQACLGVELRYAQAKAVPEFFLLQNGKAFHEGSLIGITSFINNHEQAINIVQYNIISKTNTSL